MAKFKKKSGKTKGSKVGPRKVNVPNLIGLSRSAAKNLLSSVGLTYTESSTTTSVSSEENTVSSQNISTSESINIGSSISFVYKTYVPPYSNPPPYYNPPPEDPPYYNPPPEDPPYYNPPPEDPPYNNPPAYTNTYSNPPFSGMVFVYSVGPDTKVLTVSGYKAAKDLVVGEEILSLNVEEITTSGQMLDLENWSSNSFTSNGLVTTTINKIRSSVSKSQVQINGDWFSENHYILVKKNNINEFIMATDIDESYQVFNYQQLSWVDVVSIDKTFVDMTVFSIDCEPYDMFFTEGMLVYNVKENL